MINLCRRFTALQFWNCVRDDYPRAISALDLLAVLPNILLLTKGFKVTKQWLFRHIFFREMYLVMHGVEGECWDSFFWLHPGFSTLSLRCFSFYGVSGSRRWVSFNTTVFLVLVDPMLCLLNLPLSEIRRIKSESISDLEEGLCMYDPSPFSLILELWVRSRY